MRNRLPLLATAAILGVGVALLVGNVHVIVGQWGVDATLYFGRTRLWLDGAPLYLPHQVAGPYTVAMGDVMYPPTTLLLFLPFLVLPAALWWAIPIAVIGYVLWRLSPRPWGWPIMAAILVWPPTLTTFIYGNPGLWIAAFVAAGTLWRWPAALVLLKPTLAPFALIGVRTRSWWVAVVALAAASLAFFPLWADWLRVIVNARGDVTYSLGQAPLLSLPLVAWLAARYPRRTLREPAAEAGSNG